ncbi:MAG: hypothetical protein P1U32_05355 [Legionellaceae bacterium]|nr:hypothetical protein [Legionellaceae bacterium]
MLTLYFYTEWSFNDAVVYLHAARFACDFAYSEFNQQYQVSFHPRTLGESEEVSRAIRCLCEAKRISVNTSHDILQALGEHDLTPSSEYCHEI